MGGTHGFALAAAQAIFHTGRNRANVRLLHDQRLVAHQAKAGGVGMRQVGGVHIVTQTREGRAAQQLAFVETPLGVHFGFVSREVGQLGVGQKLQLGDANAVLARDDAVEAAGQHHDAGHRLVRGLQHLVVVGVHGDIGVHIAVTGMHVQRHPNTALKHALMDGNDLGQDRQKGRAGKDVLEGRADLRFPAGPQSVLLQLGEQVIDLRQPSLPLGLHLAHHRQGLRHAVFQQLGRRDVVGVVLLAQRQVAPLQKGFDFAAQLELVAQTQLDVDALDAIGVLGHARQRNHHVFVDLEGVGVARNGGGLLTVQPELFARLGADGNEAFAAARVGNADDLGCRLGHVVGVVTGDVTDQHHFGETTTLALGGITHRPQIAVVQMLQACHHGAGALLLGKHEIFDLDDAGHCLAGVAKELHAHRAGVRGHAVHDPAGAGDQAVAAFFLHARQAREELVGHVLAQAFLAEGFAGDDQGFGADRGFAIGFEIAQLKRGDFGVVDLAHVVVHANHIQPFGVGGDHAPAGQVVEGCPPEHRLFATRVHGDVAANAAGFGRSWVDREHKTTALGRIGHALGDHTGFGPDGGNRVGHAGQVEHLDLGHGFEFFGVHHRALPSQRNSATGVARAAAPGHDGQAQVDTALDQTRHFFF